VYSNTSESGSGRKTVIGNNKHKRYIRVHNGDMGLNNGHKRERHKSTGMNNKSARPNNRPNNKGLRANNRYMRAFL